jgi:hopanoid C-2 methylase
MRRSNKKRILIVNCYLDELRIALRRQNKVPHQMIIAFLAGLFSPDLCDIILYDEVYSGPLENETLLAFPEMMVLTGLNTSFDRMMHLTAYVRTKNTKTAVVAGGPAIRALHHYAKQFFDYCCTGDIEQLHEVIVAELGEEYVAPSFLEKGWVIPRYDLTYWIKPNIITYVESSRNCYFNCNFCSITAENGKYQSYEIEYLREQLDAQFSVYGKQGVVHFIDNTFASFDRSHLLDRFSLLKELWLEGYFRRWSALVTSDFFFRDENLELALDSGCMALFSGVETFDHKALLDFRKTQNTRLPQEEIIRKCLNAGIAFLYGLVFDLTSRPIAELKKELDFIVDNPEITLPSFVSVAVPILKSPFFYDCIDRKLFLPNIKIRDMDSTTIILRPLDDMGDAMQFVKDVQNLNGYRLRVARHIKNFYASYKSKLSRGKMVLAQSNGFLLCTPKLLTATSDLGKLILNGSERPSRTFVGSTELLDRVYQPAFPIDPRYQHYFLPTMLTDKEGNISEALHEDLLPANVT